MVVIIFMLALIIGSFLNVVIYRLPLGESILFPSSYCPKCNIKLKWYELIPVIGYFLNGGKCRYCQEKISLQYPLVEIFNGILWLFLYIKFGLTLEFFYFSLLTSLLLSISVIDLQHTIIPDSLNLMGLIGGLVYIFSSSYLTIGKNALGLLVGGGAFLLIALLTKGGMGGGDIKLMAVMGLWFGWPSILSIMFLSFIIGAIASIGLLLLKIKGCKDIIPFAPFIFIAVYLNFFLGEKFIIFFLS